jgi:hypothetical protein
MKRLLFAGNRAGPVCFVIGLLLLARTHLYYGTLLRGWDAQFYYAAARSLVFDGDLDITNDIVVSSNPRPLDPDGDGTFRNIPRRPDGRVVNVFPVGLSLIEAPGLLAGYALRSVAGNFGYRSAAAHGFSQLEIDTVAIWLLTISSFGLHQLFELLAGRSTVAWRALSLAAAWAGTSLLYYSAVFPFMAHAVAFTLVVCIARLARDLRSGESPNRKVVLTGALTGLLFLVRPQQVLIAAVLVPVLLPALWRRPWREWLPGAVLGLAIVVAAVLFQATVHEANVGSFGILGRDRASSHPAVAVHFRWSEPHLFEPLVSPTRGMFFLTPVWILGMAGSLSVAAKPGYWLDRVFLIQTLLQVYLSASWSDPTQGDSFGARMLCEETPLVALGLTALYRPRPAVKLALTTLTILCVVWTCAVLLLYLKGGLAADIGYRDVLRAVFAPIVAGR